MEPPSNHDQHSSVRDLLLMDVTPLTIGINVTGDITSVKIKRNTTIPVKKTFGMETSEDGTTAVRFMATEGNFYFKKKFTTSYSGERTMTKDNKILGSFLLEGIPPGPRGQEKFDVTFDINSDGILTVTATHRRNRGNTGSMKIDARTSEG